MCTHTQTKNTESFLARLHVNGTCHTSRPSTIYNFENTYRESRGRCLALYCGKRTHEHKQWKETTATQLQRDIHQLQHETPKVRDISHTKITTQTPDFFGRISKWSQKHQMRPNTKHVCVQKHRQNTPDSGLVKKSIE